MVSEPAAADPTSDAGSQLLVLTGLSGAGKTVALRALEDLDYYCVDNLPAALIPDLVAAVHARQPGRYPRIAVGIDVRNRSEDLVLLPEILAGLAGPAIPYQLVFLDTRDEVLFKRYSETRRRHPLSHDGIGLSDAIALERRLLRPLSAIADRVIDSSELNVHQLRRLIATAFGKQSAGLTLLLVSFAYKRGLPADADYVFDARCLPNPHWDPALRPLSGRDLPVRKFFDAVPESTEFCAQIQSMLDRWLPLFEAEQRGYLTVAIGCTGGRHRSVFVVERLAERYRAERADLMIHHRELE